MSLLHPSPRKERNQTPIHRIIATITSSNCHFLLNLNSSYCSTVGGSGRGGGAVREFPFCFFSFFFALRLGCSDLTFDMNTKCYMLLLTSSKWDGENTAVLGKVLYNNGMIFLFWEIFFFHCMLFSPPFCPVSLPFAVDGLFCINADYVASLFHLVNWKLLLNQTAVCLLYLRPSPPTLMSSNLVISNVTFYTEDQYSKT